MRMFIFLLALMMSSVAMAEVDLATDVTKNFVGATQSNLSEGAHILTCTNPTDIKATVYIERSDDGKQWFGKATSVIVLKITGDGPTGDSFIVREPVPFYRLVIEGVSGSKPLINCDLT